MPLITAAQAREHIPSITGTSMDTYLDELILRIGDVFARHCGYVPVSAGVDATMQSTSRVVYMDGPGGRELRLPVWPVTAIASIYDDSQWTWGASTLVASSDYAILDGLDGIVLLTETSTHGSWSTGRRAIKATVTAGWSAVPSGLEMAAILAVRNTFNLRAEQGRSNVSGNGVSLGLRDEELLPPVVRAALSSYRLPSALFGGGM